MRKNVENYLISINSRDQDRFERWSIYRNTLTDDIIKVLLERPKGDVLILGSGSLDDLDLKALRSHTLSIHCLDLDIESTHKGFMRQGFEINDISCIKKDITRFDDIHFFELWNQFIQNEPTAEDTVLFTDKMMNTIYEKHFQFDLQLTFDIVILLPMYTQLIYQEWVEMIDQFHPQMWTQDDLRTMKSYILDLMVPLIDHVNEGIYACIKPGGLMVALSDLLEWNASDFNDFKKVHPSLSDHELMNYYLSYLNQYGMGLGDYGLWSLKSLLNLESSSFRVWPFSVTRTMLVQTMVLSK